MKREEIDSKQGLQILGKSLSDIAIGALTSLIALNPQVLILVVTAQAVYSAWGAFGQARLNELLEALENEVDDFKEVAVRKEEFSALFLSVLEKHMRETDSEKRAVLRRYLISVAKGECASFSNHTKLLLIMDQITADELRLFMLLPTIIEDFKAELEALGGTLNDLNANSHQIKIRLRNWSKTDSQIEQLLRFLSNYGLIVSIDFTANTLGGGTPSLQFKGLTDSGWALYRLLDHPSIDKAINNVR